MSARVTYGGVDTQIASGGMNGPAANAVIATIAAGSLGAGTYEVLVTIGFTNGGGVPSATDAANWILLHGTTPLTNLITPANYTGGFPQYRIPRMTIADAEAISVTAGASNGTANVSYDAVLSATQVV